MIYVYAIAERAPADPGDPPLRAVTHGGLAGVYSPAPTPVPHPTPEALWQHEHAVERLMGEGAVLPLRFGSTLDDTAALRDLLRTREREFAAALDFVRGAAEVSVHARLDLPDEPPPRGSGRAYLAAKLDRRRLAVRMATELQHQLAPFARASTFRTEPGELAAAYLVDRSRVDEVARRVRELGARRPDAELACSGPWPPYSFTEPRDA